MHPCGHRLIDSSRHRAQIFTSRGQLLEALQAWCADSAATIALNGPIKDWDVSAVTEMNKLIYDLPCKSTFNEARAAIVALQQCEARAPLDSRAAASA